MKKISITFFLSLLFCTLMHAQVKSKAEIKFNKNVHDYGSIKEEAEIAVSEFEFTNVGEGPVIIQRVVASCGCTAPSYTREPVLPGKSGKIKVSYHTVNRPGNFRKNIRVYTNVPDTIYTLTIQGHVAPKKR